MEDKGGGQNGGDRSRSGRAGRSSEAGTSRIQRDSEQESTRALHHLGVRDDCPHGDRGQQNEGMTWKQIKTEALRIVDEAAQRKPDRLVHLRQRCRGLIRCIGKRVGNGIQEQGGMYRFGNNLKHMPRLRRCV